jgi:hypothetical protein
MSDETPRSRSGRPRSVPDFASMNNRGSVSEMNDRCSRTSTRNSPGTDLEQNRAKPGLFPCQVSPDFVKIRDHFLQILTLVFSGSKSVDSEDSSPPQAPRTPFTKSSCAVESAVKSEKDFASVLGGGSPSDGNEIDARTGMPFWVQVLFHLEIS